uniref:Golgin B1 n=1 Tax=Leptobrachium leishanense TaxID=445787 RepID=A0A8C5MP14_9ANUR
MFSRLSGLANTVLHELSGDGESTGSTGVSEPAAADTSVEDMSEDQREQRSHYEQLVVHLKVLIQQKDEEIKQRDSQLKVERESADAKLAKLKLQAKAKVVNLNKQIEELKKAAGSPVNQSVSDDSFSQEQREPQQHSDDEERRRLLDNVSELTCQLQERDESIITLTKQLQESQSSVTELLRQLEDSQQSVTELTRELHNSQETLSELHATREKHETEIKHLQRNLEEHVESLLSRTQVVEMLEQELQSAEVQKQVLTEQYRHMEKELHSLTETLDATQKENLSQSAVTKDHLQEKNLLCQRLQEELEQERTAKEKFQALNEELKNAHGMQDELNQLKEDTEREKSAHDVLEQLRGELESVKGAQDELQRIKNALEVERQAQEILAQYREELERVKGTEEMLETTKRELESEKAAQDMLGQVREELVRVKGARDELQAMREELEHSREAQETLVVELETARNVHKEFDSVKEEMVRVTAVRNELERMKEELERENRACADLERVQNELEHGRGVQEKLEQLREELKRQQEAQAELVRVGEELERIRSAQEEMNREKEELKVHAQSLTEKESTQKVLEGEDGVENVLMMDEHQAERVDHDLLDRDKDVQEKAMAIEDVLIEVAVQGHLGSGPGFNVALKEVNEEKAGLESEISLCQVSNTTAELKAVCEELQLTSSVNSAVDSRESISVMSLVSHLTSSTESHQDLVEEQSVQVLTSDITKEFTITMEGVREKQLSILMVDINDAREEMEKLKGRMAEENEPDFHKKSAQTMEKSEQLIEVSSEERTIFTEVVQETISTTITKVQKEVHKEELGSSTTISIELTQGHEELTNIVPETDVIINSIQECQEDNSENNCKDVRASLCAVCNDCDRESEVLLLKKMAADLKTKVEALSFEREVLTAKLQNVTEELGFTQGLQSSSGRNLKDLEELQIANYESQNMLKEQLNSLENESKSKDLKISALQKDLDHLHLLFSEQESLAKTKTQQLDEEESRVKKMDEMLNHSQSKEERLSEALAANEREMVSLQELLSEKNTQVENLQLSLAEKDQQVAEISHSFSDKVVLLNEEKHTMDKEIRTLREQLNLCAKEQNGEMEGLTDELKQEKTKLHNLLEEFNKEKLHLQENLELKQKEKEELHTELESLRSKNLQDQETLKSGDDERTMLQVQLQEYLQKQKEHEELLLEVESLRHAHSLQQDLLQRTPVEPEQSFSKAKDGEKESKSKAVSGLQKQLERQQKDNEQLKKKLQAALANRKDLMKKVSELEKGLRRGTVKLEVASTCSNDNTEVGSDLTKVQEKDTANEYLKQQLSEREAELENVKRELVERSAETESLQSRIEQMTLELHEKTTTIDLLNTEKVESLFLIQSLMAAPAHTEIVGLTQSVDHENASKMENLENRIADLELEKETLQKKIQDSLNSRRDTIKKAKEKDRHHREQLKQQKEEFNSLQEKYEALQKNQTVVLEPQESRSNHGRETMSVSQQTSVELGQEEHPSKESETQFPGVAFSEKDTPDSGWGSDWVDFSSTDIKDTLVDGASSNEPMLESYKAQVDTFKTQKEELELRTSQIEEQLAQRLEEVSHLQDNVEQLSRLLDTEKEKYEDCKMQATILKAELESKLLETTHQLESEMQLIREELNVKREEILNLNLTVEERNRELQNVQISLSDNEHLIAALKLQLENQTREFQEHSGKLELQVLEVQQKQEEEVEEESKGKQQLQRKLQAALISRKEALKENKTQKTQLETMKAHQEAVSQKLYAAESSVKQLHSEKGQLLEKLTIQKEERDKLIAEVDKCLMGNQNLEASCESLKVALTGITSDKEALEKELHSLRLSQVSQNSEWQEKLAEQQKEYETLLQSYENVSDETDRMKRSVEAVKLEKQEVLSKLRSMEAAKREVEVNLEEAEQQLEGMKEKMRKFAKSKQQKILELEEENERLTGDLQPNSDAHKKLYDAALSENNELKAELKKVHLEKKDLTAQLEVVKSEKATLEQQEDKIRFQLEGVTESITLQKAQESSKDHIQNDVCMQEAVTLNSSPPIMTEEQGTEALLPAVKDTEFEKKQENENMQKIHHLERLVEELGNNAEKKEEMVEAMRRDLIVLKEEKISVEGQLAITQDQVSVLQEQIMEFENNYRNVKGEMVELQNLNRKSKTDFEEILRQKEMLEFEKDELEERLMNQLAELNGSIGNYQQDAMDLQVKNDHVQGELQNVRLQLEEEKRQLERQKLEALSQVQKEYVEKLKSVHDGEKGRKSQTKELQELLKEKQQEVRHLQKDCIHYQETISGLERAIKALEFAHSEYEKEKLSATESLSKASEDTRQAKADITSLRILLDDSQSETARVAAENQKLKENLHATGEEITLKLKRKDEDLEIKLQQERDKHSKEMLNAQEKLKMLQLEKEQLQESINSLQSDLGGKGLELREMQDNLNQNVAKLAAFTRSMCSLQNDRDRIIEESKKWNKTFDDTMKRKDDEISEKEKTCVALNDEMKQVSSRVEELQVQLNRLELQNQELSTSLKTETETSLKTRDTLVEEKTTLSSRLEEEQKLHNSCREELRLRSSEAAERLDQLQALEFQLKQLKSEKEDLLGETKRLEAEVQDWKLSSEQVQSDLQASKTLTEQLHRELEQKEQDVVRLLSARDEAVSTAVGELHELHAAESRALQERLAESESECRQLQEKSESVTSQLRSTQEESGRSKAHLDAIAKSMCSLQEERERILSDYQQLEQRHINAILAKDELIQEAAREGNELREELRYQRSHADDLNAQNAKLNAELTRYREDLKEIILLKDSQLKQLLGEKVQEIDRMRQEQNVSEQQLKEDEEHLELLEKGLEEVTLEKEKMQSDIDHLTQYVSQLQSEMESSEIRLVDQEEELKRLEEALSKRQKESDGLKEECSRVKAEAEQRVQSAEEEVSKKLRSIQHDTGILRNETETAEARVAELARDLMDAEQHLLRAKEENSALRAQRSAFEGSMRSLQDSHDFAQEEIQRLRDQLKTTPSPQEDLRTLTAERDRLKDLLSQNSEEQLKMQAQLEEHAQRLQAREAEIGRMNSELQASQKKHETLTQTVGNVQEKREHLQGDLRRPYMEVERTLKNADLDVGKVSDTTGNNPLLAELQSTKGELQNLHAQITDALAQVHHKDLRIQQLSGKLSHIFEEKNALSLQLRGSSQNLRDALNRNASLERQLQDLQPVTQEVLLTNSAVVVSREKKDYQTGRGREFMELQQRYVEMEQMNNEAEHARMELEQQLREERRRAEEREQEIEGMQRLRPHDWSISQDPDGASDLSLLIEPEDVMNGTISKTRGSSLRRRLQSTFFSRTRTPALAALYILVIHVLLLLCFTGHL